MVDSISLNFRENEAVGNCLSSLVRHGKLPEMFVADVVVGCCHLFISSSLMYFSLQKKV
jgi:hypothetical protein